MTGSQAAIGEELRHGAEKAAGYQCRRRRDGPEAALTAGDDACDPKQAVSAANDVACRASSSSTATIAPARRSRPPRPITRQASCRCPWLDQSGADRRRGGERLDQRLSHRRARRRAGQDRRRISGEAVQGQGDRHHRRQVGLRQRPRRRDAEGPARRRRRGDRRADHRRRPGFRRPDQQAQGGPCRGDLLRRL